MQTKILNFSESTIDVVAWARRSRISSYGEPVHKKTWLAAFVTNETGSRLIYVCAQDRARGRLPVDARIPGCYLHSERITRGDAKNVSPFADVQRESKKVCTIQHVAAGPSCQTMVRVDRTYVSKQCTVKGFSMRRRRNPRFHFVSEPFPFSGPKH
jgi:hypothetical protein